MIASVTRARPEGSPIGKKILDPRFCSLKSLSNLSPPSCILYIYTYIYIFIFNLYLYLLLYEYIYNSIYIYNIYIYILIYIYMIYIYIYIRYFMIWDVYACMYPITKWIFWRFSSICVFPIGPSQPIWTISPWIQLKSCWKHALTVAEKS
jgi:hypothetical protein